MRDTNCDDEQSAENNRSHEDKKLPIVPLSYTGSEPDTMMVEAGNTVVANIAVCAVFGTKDVTCLTVL